MKQQVREKFNQINRERAVKPVRVSKKLTSYLNFMQWSIKKQLQSFKLFEFCTTNTKNNAVDDQFQSSFLRLSLEQRTNYYYRANKAIFQRIENTSIQYQAPPFSIISVKLMKGFKTEQPFAVNFQNNFLTSVDHVIPLNNYILRSSKKNQANSNSVCCLDAIRVLPVTEPFSLRFNILGKTQADKQFYFNAFKKLMYSLFQDYMWSMANIPIYDKKKKIKNQNIDTINQLKQGINLSKNWEEKSMVEELIKVAQEQTFGEEIFDLVGDSRTNNLNNKAYKPYLLDVILPNYRLQQLQTTMDWTLQQSRSSIRIFSNRRGAFRVMIDFNRDAQTLTYIFSEIRHSKLWNKQVTESCVRMQISSQNSAIVYQKHISYNKWYRQRDYLFMRHLCKLQDSSYIIDKSVQNPCFIPFSSIQRGQIQYAITKITPTSSKSCSFIHQILFKHQGLLNATQHKNLSTRYLIEFINLHSYTPPQPLHHIFQADWKVMPNYDFKLQNKKQTSLHSIDFGNASDLMSQSSFHTINENQQILSEHEIDSSAVNQSLKNENYQAESQEIQVDGNGHTIASKEYLKIKHVCKPWKSSIKKAQLPYKNTLLKGDFVIQTQGGIKLVNQTKINAQNNVISFVMSAMKKNLFSGKSILNISLPVEIFRADSNLQHLCQAMSLAPNLLQKVANANTLPIERMKQVMAFAFTNAILYFDIDKPFNPILGQTFQGSVGGSLVYGEQTSHHPPISSMLLVGKGYRVYASLQAKMNVGINSADGINEGYYYVQFEDGALISFHTSPGEVNGLLIGDRKFAFKKYIHVIDMVNNLVGYIHFEEQCGFFDKRKWKTSDQLGGMVYKVTPQFIKKLKQKKGSDAPIPDEKYILDEYCKVTGRWTSELQIDGETVYDIEKDIPFPLLHYPTPLPSNSDYREDLYYRKKDDLARSQIQKERLEILQRQDKKLREKYKKPH